MEITKIMNKCLNTKLPQEQHLQEAYSYRCRSPSKISKKYRNAIKKVTIPSYEGTSK